MRRLASCWEISARSCVIGMTRLLSEDGAEVIGQEKHPSSIVSAAGRLRPDVVVLDLNTEGSRELSSRVQRVSPETKVILCASDEDGMEVLDPGRATAARVAVGAPEELRRRAGSKRSYHEVKE